MLKRRIQNIVFVTVAFTLFTTIGCSSVDHTSKKIFDSITPYKIEVVQGNFVSRQQVELVRPGMSREQVRDILGAPLVASLFHADRWDYVFTIKRKGVELETKRLTAYFSGYTLEKIEGDEMPSEEEFVARLGQRNNRYKVPALEASPEQLKAAQASAKKVAGKEGSAKGELIYNTEAKPASSYPSLE